MLEQHSDTEIHVKAKQTLDNGLTVGAVVEMEGEVGAIDEQYLTLDGPFGRIIMGSENTAGYLMHYSTKSNGIGVEEGDGAGAWIAGAANGLSRSNLHTAVSSDDNSVTYFSPRINGIQLGVSYVPEINDNDKRTPAGDKNARAAALSTTGSGVTVPARASNQSRTNDGFRDNAFSIGANYMGEFDAMSVKISAGYTDGGTDAAAAGSEMAATGAIQIGFGGFTAAFAYGEHDRDNAVGSSGAQNVNTFGASLSYNAGPAGVSLAYLRGEDSPTDDKQDQIEVGASYAIGPGVTAKSSLYYIERTNNGAEAANGVAVAAGLALSF
jgi:predicted porin